MRYKKFYELGPAQQLTLLIAIHVRNSMEDFHAEHLSDAQMEKLNKIIRQAIFDVVTFTNKQPGSYIDQKQAELAIDWLVKMVPEYWETPEKTSGSLELPEDFLKKMYGK